MLAKDFDVIVVYPWVLMKTKRLNVKAVIYNLRHFKKVRIYHTFV